MRLGQRLLVGALVVIAVFLIVVMALTERDVRGQLAGDVLIAGAVATGVALALAIFFSRAVTQPIVELRDVARAIADGDLSRRPALSAPGEVGDLASAVRRMAELLVSRLAMMEADETLLVGLVEALNEGVLAIGSDRRVVRANAAARRLLALRDTLPFPLDRLPRDRVLREALDHALAGGSTDGMELTLEGRTLALTARPLASGGAVVALFDLTAMRRLETIRRDFVANVSHELRTPLTAVSGFAETLADENVAEDERRRFANTIRINAQRMQRIVDDLLDLSRIESGGWVPNPMPVDVEAIAAEAAAPCQRVASDKGVDIRVEVDARARSAMADPTALRQILANLVDNAVRYTNAGGSVTVFTEPDSDGVWVGVKDTGSGISAEHLPRIFERFYRVDPGRSREAGGTGLGLSIVKHLAEAHGGRVHAESIPRRGTRVAAFFPDGAVTRP